MSRRVPLRWKITIGATAIVAVAFIILSLAVTGLLRRSIADDTESLLVTRVDAVEDLVVRGDLPTVLESTGREVGQIQVVDASGSIVSRTPGLAATTRFDVMPPPPVGADVAATVGGASIDDDPNEDYRVVARSVAAEPDDLTIYAVTSLDPARRAEGYLRERLLLVSPVLVLVVGFVVFRVVARALAPVDAMRAEVDRIEVTDLSIRVSTDVRDEEITNLGRTLNRLLSRLESAAARQQPRHRTNCAARSRRSEPSWRWACSTRIAPIGNARAIAVSELHRRVSRHELVDDTGVDPAWVVGEPDAVVQVVRNLLDNAERHATSKIEVTLSHGHTLRVSNDGPPIAEADRERIFEPFTRLDEARALDAGGSGLGLAIVRNILRSMGASISVEPQTDGVCFVVDFRPRPTK